MSTVTKLWRERERRAACGTCCLLWPIIADADEAQAFYDDTDQAVIDAEDASEDAKRRLAEITGVYPDSIAPLREDVPLAKPVPDSADDWAAAARKDNIEVLSASLGAEAARRNVQATQAKYWPTLSLQGSLTRQHQDEGLGGDQIFDSVGVTVNWPIYQGGTVMSLVRQAKAACEQAQSELEMSKRRAEREARAAYRGVSSGVARIQAAKRAVASSHDAEEASRPSVEFGTRTEFDLPNAQNDYFNTLRAYHQSRYDYLTAVLKLKQQTGHLLEADLQGIDQLLVSSAAPGAAP